MDYDFFIEIEFYRSLRKTETNIEALQTVSEESQFSNDNGIAYTVVELENAIRRADAWIPDGTFAPGSAEPDQPKPLWIRLIPGCMWIALAILIGIPVSASLGIGGSDTRSPVQRNAEDVVCKIVQCVS